MKNFMLYAGPPRTGSTWLYGALNGRGDCDFTETKEYFLFYDFTLNPEFDKTTFYDYYEQRALNSNIVLMGEMSTTNCYLSREQLFEFKNKAKNFNILPVMTIRDPITQLRSSAKLSMYVELLGRDSIKIASASMDNRLLPNAEQTLDFIIEHGKKLPFGKEHSWQQTYENYMEVFGKIHVNFYETLFTDDSMNKLCDYLELPRTKFNFSTVVHKMGENISLSNDEMQKIYDSNQEVQNNYRFAVNVFGKEFIESIWWTPNK